MLPKYMVRRLITTIPTLLAVTFLVFSMIHLMPGDPIKAIFRQEPGDDGEITPEVIESLNKKFGFDKPLPEQYVRYMWKLFQGDMGRSTIYSRPVLKIILEKIPQTAELALTAMIFAVLIGVPLGIISAARRGKWADTIAMLIAMFGVSMPNFWFGLIAIMLFAVTLGWLPSSGTGGIEYLILPAITLGTSAAAIIARLTRSSLLEVLQEDYINTARSKGVRELKVLWVHALRNSLIPVLTIVGLQFGSLLAGTIVVETVFARSGLGILMITAVTSKDIQLAQGLILIIAVIYIVVNMFVDMLYAVLDPRIEYS